MPKERYALLGHPLGHSLSPQVHAGLMRLAGGDWEYGLLDAPDLEEALPQLRELDGFNVTIPYKQAILPHLAELDAFAAALGSVNTVARREGRWVGYNTDCIGFERSLREAGIFLGPAGENTPEGALPARQVCVVGVGGVGRMFAIVSALRGADVTLGILPRHRERSDALCRDILAAAPGCRVQTQLTEHLSGEYDLVINATPCGMFPHTEESPLAAESLQGAKALFDCIYNPRETLLMRQAAEAGCRVVGGLPMLVWQAAAAQEIWHPGLRFSPEDLAGLGEEAGRAFELTRGRRT